MPYDKYTKGYVIPLEYHWSTTGIILEYHWDTTGLIWKIFGVAYCNIYDWYCTFTMKDDNNSILPANEKLKY